MTSYSKRIYKKKSVPPSAPMKMLVWSHLQLITFLLAINLLLTGIIGILLFLFISLDIPNISSIASYRPNVASVIFDDRGEVIDRVFKQNRTIVTLDQMPRLLPKAFIAAEDARFYQHIGVDGWSILRAVIHNIRSGHRGQGGSTITQQVARSLLLSREKTYLRKIREAILAYRIDRSLTKDEILQIYLNEIYLGAGAYGVAAAAQVYFGKTIDEINLAEASLLAGLPQAPSRNSPFRHYKRAKHRQAYVLNRMAAEGFITPTAARRAYRQPLLWSPTTNLSPAKNKHFIQHVTNYITRKYGRDLLMTGGLQIFTTLDQTLQKQADLAVQMGITRWRIRQNASRAGAMLPQAGLIAIEVGSGHLKAVVGGTDFMQSQFNRATQARRQPGSAFKPLIYAAALNHNWTPATIIMDEPLQLRGATPGTRWRPRNFSNKFYGPTTLRDGLVYSRNITTIRLLQEIGISEVIKLARQMGITSALSDNLSLALGSSGVSLLELTAAYGVFANQGKYLPPIFITKILDRHGNILEQNKPRPRPILDKQTAYQVTHMLKGVINEGTARNIRQFKAEAAGKTGTTNQYMDAWFVGYTPKIVSGVWVGFDTKKTLGKMETGSKAAAPIWRDFMTKAQENYPSTNFIIPDNIAILPIISATDDLTDDETQKISLGAFRTDNQPRQTSNVLQYILNLPPL